MVGISHSVNITKMFMGHYRPLLVLFSVFSSKQNNFHDKLMSKMSIKYPGAGIRTHDLLNMSLLS